MEEELLELAQTYFKVMDEEVKGEFLELIVNAVIDNYKTLRNYPDSYTDEMIEADVNRYFNKRKYDVALELIPELYGRIGAEGLSMLTDAGTTRMWKNSTIFSDVVPMCEVV